MAHILHNDLHRDVFPVWPLSTGSVPSRKAISPASYVSFCHIPAHFHQSTDISAPENLLDGSVSTKTEQGFCAGNGPPWPLRDKTSLKDLAREQRELVRTFPAQQL